MNLAILKREVIAGITSFVTSVYLTIAIPLILTDSGIPMHHSFMATCLLVAIATLSLAIFTKLPIMAGPGLALSTFIGAEMIHHLAFSLSQALGLICIAGCFMVLLGRLGAIQHIEKILAKHIVLGATVGIGLLFLLISVKMAQVFSLTSLHFNLLNLFGWSGTLAMIKLLNNKQIPGAILISILCFSGGFQLMHLETIHAATHAMHSTFTWQPPTFSGLFQFKGLFAVLSLVLVSLIDSIATLHALLDYVDLKQPKPQQQMATVKSIMNLGAFSFLSGLINCAPLSIYLESGSGIVAGARTQIASLTVAGCFLLCLPLHRFLYWIPNCISAAALSYVAIQMIKTATKLKWQQLRTIIAPITIIITLPATMSIAIGVGAGIVVEAMQQLFHQEQPKTELLVLAAILMFYITFNLFNM